MARGWSGGKWCFAEVPKEGPDEPSDSFSSKPELEVGGVEPGWQSCF
jgi:hypothetical protein